MSEFLLQLKVVWVRFSKAQKNLRHPGLPGNEWEEGAPRVFVALLELSSSDLISKTKPGHEGWEQLCLLPRPDIYLGIRIVG